MALPEFMGQCILSIFSAYSSYPIEYNDNLTIVADEALLQSTLKKDLKNFTAFYRKLISAKSKLINLSTEKYDEVTNAVTSTEAAAKLHSLLFTRRSLLPIILRLIKQVEGVFNLIEYNDEKWNEHLLKTEKEVEMKKTEKEDKSENEESNSNEDDIRASVEKVLSTDENDLSKYSKELGKRQKETEIQLKEPTPTKAAIKSPEFVSKRQKTKIPMYGTQAPDSQSNDENSDAEDGNNAEDDSDAAKENENENKECPVTNLKRHFLKSSIDLSVPSTSSMKTITPFLKDIEKSVKLKK